MASDLGVRGDGKRNTSLIQLVCRRRCSISPPDCSSYGEVVRLMKDLYAFIRIIGFGDVVLAESVGNMKSTSQH